LPDVSEDLAAGTDEQTLRAEGKLQLCGARRGEMRVRVGAGALLGSAKGWQPELLRPRLIV